MLIAFTGKKQSGKTTASDYLFKYHNFLSYAFAGKLKLVCQDLFALSNEQVDGNLKERIDERYGLSPRNILQKFGSEVGREIYRDIWIKCLERKIQHLLDNKINIVISDLRFNNEAEWIQSKGGLIVALERPQTEVNDTHISESGINTEYIDYRIINTYDTLEDFYIEIDKVVYQFNKIKVDK